MKSAPDIRVRALPSGSPNPVRPDGTHVLYWMVGFRRPRWNFALQHAAAHATRLGKPLVVLEALRVGYPWASDRLHQFVLDGMRANEAYFRETPATYFPYVEPEEGHGRGLLAALASSACVVVSDDYPTFFIPRMQQKAAASIKARLELVDSNGLLPIRATDRVFSRAFDFRRFLQRNLLDHLDEFPVEGPLQGLSLPRPTGRLLSDHAGPWEPASDAELRGDSIATLPIDHDVGKVDFQGGYVTGEATARAFLDTRIDRYATERSHPDANAASGLSPWLHFGHVSAHQVFHELTLNEGWDPDHVSSKRGGQREGWWGMSQSAEAFLDELITWREVGYNMSTHQDNYDQYESLPGWAQQTLSEHENDSRPHVYTQDQFARSETHDPIWNAAQRELVTTGRMQNYLRMLWGKKILEWSSTPRDALATMVELNNRYAVDGRDPNSYSGIFWVLGRYDRAWGPERPIFGKIRYMSSDNTKRKLRMRDYLARFDAQATLF
ncbi:MAG: deoxyribodipyrimidine photolyase [Myxococcota bacterium]